MGTAIDRIAASRQPKLPKGRTFTHGTVHGYQSGCKCTDCMDASAAARRRTRANRKPGTE